MSFTQGLSGLNAASKDLEVIGNNVANVNTVGFKASQAQFADVFAASLGGAGQSQIGIGTKLATVAQQFTQGSDSTTNNPLDMAINGPGFFIMHGTNGTGYTRNGQFQVDKSGYIVSSTGENLQGWPATAGIVANSGPTSNLQISSASIPPVATTSIAIGMNVDSRSTAIATPTTFDPLQPATYTSSTSTTVYDTLGNARQNTLYFQNIGGSPDVWNVYTTVTDPNAAVTTPPTYLYPSPTPAAGAWVPDGTLSFDTVTGALTGSTSVGAGAATNQIQLASFAPQFPNGITYDFTGSTEYGATFGVTKMTTNGYTTGQLVGYSAAASGIITGQYSNGQTQVLGQVALATFADNQGLQSIGDNEWSSTTASGPALTGVPGSGLNGVLQTSSVEDSNTDLTAELVNMITAQRNYQANAQTIKTQDAVMQTLINMR
jgi:flagellar hook protein FlgE